MGGHEVVPPSPHVVQGSTVLQLQTELELSLEEDSCAVLGETLASSEA